MLLPSPHASPCLPPCSSRKVNADDEICRKLARRKVQNVSLYREQQTPTERRMPGILVGDNGEGDVDAAAELLQLKHIEHAFIRKLTKGDAALFIGKRPTSRPVDGITYFDNFAGVRRRSLSFLFWCRSRALFLGVSRVRKKALKVLTTYAKTKPARDVPTHILARVYSLKKRKNLRFS